MYYIFYNFNYIYVRLSCKKIYNLWNYRTEIKENQGFAILSANCLAAVRYCYQRCSTLLRSCKTVLMIEQYCNNIVIMAEQPC